MIRIKRRTMCIPKEEAYIGTVDDSNAESRIFQIERYTESQSDIGNLTFKLITINEKGKENPIYLTKAVDESHVFLTWTIIGSDIEASGTLLVQIKAFDEQGMVRWNSFIGSFYIEENLNMPDVSTEKLSDYELLLSKVTKAYGMLEGSIIESIDQSGEKLIITFADGTKKEFNIGGDISQEKISEAVNAYLTANPMEEKDPTVPDWAKSPKKPTYTASEVGALPDSTNIPSSPGDVGADPAGTAESKVSVHNTSVDAHNDIRLLIEGLTSRLNALADSDDTTLDQMSEIVAYIKSNKRLIDAITTGKVSTSDIVDNLTTNAANRPLSAAQGVVLKAMIDGIAIPSNTSDLTNDSGFVELDDSLTDNTKAAPAGIVGEIKSDIEQLKQSGTGSGSGSSWSTIQIDNLKSVLYMMEFSSEALAEEGKTKIDALITSLRNGTSSGSGGSSGGGESGGGTEITLTSISAVYNGGEVQEGTSASDLDITVTANYSDGSSAVVSGWSISGTVYEGENSFIVSYGGKTTTVKVTGVKQSATSKYITDGLVFNIDAIDSETTGKSWSDVTGNYTTEIPSNGGINDKGTYINANTRSQVKVTDTALLTDMGTEFSVEAVWQNRYFNSDGIATDQTPEDTGYIFTVGYGNNNMLIANNGKCRILGSNAVYGDAFTSNDDILHCTITYDGTTYSLYHDGTLVTSMSASMDLSSQTYAEFWGCMEWAQPTNGSFNAGRIYNRCLTANEVKANYDVDIERFGTQNIATV